MDRKSGKLACPSVLVSDDNLFSVMMKNKNSNELPLSTLFACLFVCLFVFVAGQSGSGFGARALPEGMREHEEACSKASTVHTVVSVTPWVIALFFRSKIPLCRKDPSIQ